MREFFADPHEIDSLDQDLGEWDNILISFYPRKNQTPHIKFREISNEDEILIDMVIKELNDHTIHRGDSTIGYCSICDLAKRLKRFNTGYPPDGK